MRQPGYISGETLVGYNDPDLTIVISTWRSHEHWQYWVDSTERRERHTELEPLLAVPEKTTVLWHQDDE